MTTNTFTGATDSDWDVDGNWDQGHKPTSGEDAVVPNGTAVRMSNADGGCLSLTVESGGHFSFGGNINLTTVADCTFDAGSVIDASSAGHFIVGGDFDCSADMEPSVFLHLDVVGACAFHDATISKVDASGGTEADASDNCVDGGNNTNVAFPAEPPVITSVSPTHGGVGGCEVAIVGTGFVDGLGVTIGGVSATAVEVLSPTLVRCFFPAHAAAAAADVVVTNADAQADTLAAAFTYDAAITQPAIRPHSLPGLNR